MMGLSFGHLLVLFIIVLLFGSRKLPELGGALGKGLRAFKKGLDGQDTLNEEQPQITRKTDGSDQPPRV